MLADKKLVKQYKANHNIVQKWVIWDCITVKEEQTLKKEQK